LRGAGPEDRRRVEELQGENDKQEYRKWTKSKEKTIQQLLLEQDEGVWRVIVS
jgi:hypothetical protein